MITPREAKRLYAYLDRVRSQEKWTMAEATDFYKLAQRVYNELSDKGGVWLLAYATDIFAVYGMEDGGGDSGQPNLG